MAASPQSTPKSSVPPSKSASTAPKVATTQSNGDTGSSGFGKLALAALCGAILALLGQWVLSGMTAQGEAVTVPDNLEQRLAALEQQPVAASAVIDDAQIETLVQQQVAAALADGEDIVEGSDATLAALQSTLATTTGRLSTLEGAEQARSTRLDQLDQAISSGDAGDPAALAALSTNVDDVTAQLETLRTTVQNQTGADPALTQTVTTLQEQVAANQTANQAALDEIRQQSTATGEKLTALDARLTDIAANSESARQAAQQAAQTANIALQSSLTELSQSTDTRIAALTDRLENGADRVAAQALAAAALKRDVDLGVPFGGTLDTLKSVTDNTDALEPLTAYAETGVPTLIALRNRFDAVADDMRAAVAPAPADDSLASRLLAGARGAVQVRRSGESDEGIEGGITAINTALAAGKTADADAAWQALPDAAKTVSRKWHDDLTARLTASRLVSDVVDNSLRASSPAPTQ